MEIEEYKSLLHSYLFDLARAGGLKIPWLRGGNSVGIVDKILNIGSPSIGELIKHGAVLDDDQTLPKVKVDPYSSFDANLCQQDMLKAGWRKVRL